MTEQFSPNRFSTPASPHSNFVIQSEKPRPSFLSVFVPVVCGLGFFTVLGVHCYFASSVLAQKATVMKPPESAEVQRIASIPSQNDDLEPMVATPSKYGTAPEGSEPVPLAPVDSPFNTRKAPKKPPTAQKIKLAPLSPIEIVVAPKAEEIPTSGVATESDDAFVQRSTDATHPTPMPTVTTTESPIPVPEADNETSPPSE